MPRDGAERDFSVFYRSNYGKLVASIRSLAGPAAEDVAQEAFLAAQLRWDDVQDFDVPYAWVRKVARRTVWRHVERDRLRSVLEARMAAPDHWPSRDPDPDLDLVSALACLPDRDAAAIWLHHVADRPVIEVAEQLGCSVGATKVLLHRSRRRLADRLGVVRGRWVSERSWGVDGIVGHLEQMDSGSYSDIVLDDLGGRGGRWELTLGEDAYLLIRDDGLRLDYGRCIVAGHHVQLLPTLAEGHVRFRADVDGNRLRLWMVENTTPPTRGVPDPVWMNLFVESGPFSYAGVPRASV
jgi:RNA polymerase sigma-70 factor (ECF subfamily)